MKHYKIAVLLLFLSVSYPLSAQEKTVHKTPESRGVSFHRIDARNIGPYVNGVFSITTKDGVYIIDSLFNVLGAYPGKHFTYFNDNGLAPVRFADGNCCIINKKGEIIKVIPNAVAISSRFSDGIARVLLSTDYPLYYDACYINDAGDFIYPHLTVKDVMTSEIQLEPSPLVNNRRKYYDHKKERYGYIDSMGEVVIPAQYRQAQDFSDGMAAVRVDDTWGYIDTEGQVVIDAVFSIEPEEFHDGYAIVTKRNGNKVFIDKTGAIKTKERAVAKRFFYGYALICGDSVGELYIIDTNFRVIRKLDGTLAMGKLKYSDKEKVMYNKQQVYSPDGKLLLETGSLAHIWTDFEDRFVLYSSRSLLGFINKYGEVKLYFTESEF